jgi:hypothetical protein
MASPDIGGQGGHCTPDDRFMAIDPVMAGLVPAIHVLVLQSSKDVDARDKRGRDGGAAGPLF